MAAPADFPAGCEADIRAGFLYILIERRCQSSSGGFASFSELANSDSWRKMLLEEIEIDRLGDELGGPEFVGPAAPLVVTIGGNHHDREIGEPPRYFGEQLQPIHTPAC